MMSQRWSPKCSRERALALCCVLLLATSGAVGLAAAEPRTYIASASVDNETVLVGQNVTVTAVVGNVGDDRGGKVVAFKQNGSTFAERRAVVEPNEKERVSVERRLDRVGTYRFAAEDEAAGVVSVQAALARTDSTTADRRSLTVRASAVPTGEPYTVPFPAATNRSLAIEAWTVEASSESFTQSITEYDNASASGIALPQGPTATVLGVVTVGSTDEVDAATMRFAVERDALREAGVAAEDLTVYHRNGSQWEPLATTISAERPEQVVYEARATSFSTFAIGSLEPRFAIDSTGLSTSDADPGQRLALTATINNTGSVAGDYEATMLVDDDSVNETTVSVPAGETRTVTLTHVVTEAGTYEVGIGDQDAGSIVISASQVTTATATPTGSPTTGPTATATPATRETEAAGSGSGDSGLLEDVSGTLERAAGALPPTVLGINTLYVVGGAGGGLVLFLGIVALLRRRGGDEPPSSFDDW